MEIFSLSENNIPDIDTPEKVKFKELKLLKLFNDNIIDINILEKEKLEKIEIINIKNNKNNNYSNFQKNG